MESKHYLPQTLPHEDLELNERNLELILGLVQSQEFPFQCAEMITNLFCIAFYGPCDPTNNLPMQICEKQCQALNTATGSATCNKSLDLLLGIPYEGAADLFYNLNCSEFSTYFWDYTESSNITCFKLFTQSSLGNKMMVFFFVLLFLSFYHILLEIFYQDEIYANGNHIMMLLLI